MNMRKSLCNPKLSKPIKLRTTKDYGPPADTQLSVTIWMRNLELKQNDNNKVNAFEMQMDFLSDFADYLDKKDNQ